MAISYVNSADLGDNNGASNTWTAAYSIGGGANRALVLAIVGDVITHSQTDPAVTYGGTTMLKAIRNDNAGGTNARYDYLYYLLEASLPAAGAHNFIVTFTGAPNQFVILSSVELNGVLALDNTSTNTNSSIPASSLMSSITTIADDCFVVLMEQHDQSIETTVAGTGVTLRVENANFNQPALLDSNSAVTPPQSYGVTTSLSGGLANIISHTLASFSPAPVAIIKTIGSGGDYATVQLWYDGIATDAGGTNLASLSVTLAQGKVIGNLTGTLLTTSTTYTTDASHIIQLTGNTAEIYSSGLNWATRNGPSITSADNTNGTISISQPFFNLSNLQIQCTGNGGALTLSSATNVTIDSCVLSASSGGYVGSISGGGSIVMKNCVVYGTGVGNNIFQCTGSPTNCLLDYVTFAVTSNNGALLRMAYLGMDSSNVFTNCGFFSGGNATVFNDGGGTPTFVNCATDFASPPTGTAWQSGLTYASQFTGVTNATADYRALSTGGLKHGTSIVGITTDIAGHTRGATTPYIGAWEPAGGTTTYHWNLGVNV